MDDSATEIIRPLRRIEYDKLVALGVFAGERVELLEGALIEMSPIGASHQAAVQRLNRLLTLALSERAAVRCQAAFAALEYSQPEPDFAVVPRADDDTARPSTALLVIEVADSSLDRDHGKKRRIYASCAVPEYWVVNLPERCIDVYTRPASGAYALVQRYEPDESIHPLAFPDAALAVSDIIE